MMSLSYQLEILFFQVSDTNFYRCVFDCPLGTADSITGVEGISISGKEQGWQELRCIILDVRNLDAFDNIV